MFKALILDSRDGEVLSSIRSVDEASLPDGDVTVDVEYSTLNHQDGMIIKGMAGLVRHYPHIPGCDFAGTVESSSDTRFKPGDKVVLTGWRIGADRWGGFAQKARVHADWLMPLPAGLTTRSAMAIGTPGFAAMQAIMTLERHGLNPDAGEVLITGTPGGVGSMAVALLAGRAYRVIASIGNPASAEYVRLLGATSTIDRQELDAQPTQRLEPPRWAACIDSVGGSTLAHVLSQMAFGGTVAAIGLSSSQKLVTSMLPFIVRAVGLLGIHTGNCPVDLRRVIWQRLTDELSADVLEVMVHEAGLEDLPLLAGLILEGRISGRVVVDVRH